MAVDIDRFERPDARRVAVVTGATGVIGRAIAQALGSRPDFEVVLVARDREKAQAAVSEVQRRTGNPHVRCELVDLSRRASIAGFAERWDGPLQVLVNNAAITPRRREETPEGIERQFATNVLGYFWLIRALHDHLVRSAPARVVNVASYWAGGLDLDDLEFKRRRYDNDAAYRQSKQADRMLTVAFARRLDTAQVSVNACHPGDVRSTLSRNLGFGGHETPDQAARTPVWLAMESVGLEKTGRYFEHQREVACRFAADPGAVEGLYRACAAYG